MVIGGEGYEPLFEKPDNFKAYSCFIFSWDT